MLRSLAGWISSDISFFKSSLPVDAFVLRTKIFFLLGHLSIDMCTAVAGIRGRCKMPERVLYCGLSIIGSHHSQSGLHVGQLDQRRLHMPDLSTQHTFERPPRQILVLLVLFPSLTT